ncbi:hypothetical protein OB69_12495 [Roseivirga seohaensis subsp. aquiponti]|uniref:Uncharacterized protein n=1 Tax=Roseivirga seohaensis subsp. aquiponti TaxID=1566026 RepID=A0A0L8AJA7_9BACT|nr:hypothetical protein [Roseivirga seohaensis]KOF02250.1 hypothetical protein OB69_12495 [Roseivirga seohaensis subsp. aquiponti]
MNEYLDQILDYTKIVSFIFSMVALYVSLKVYKLFYFREVQKKQLDLVLKLIKDFQEFDYVVSLMSYENGTSSRVYISDGNIFSLGKTKSDLKISLLKTDEVAGYPIYLTEEATKQINISEYTHNPLMPNKISNILREIFPDKITFSKLGTTVDRSFVLMDISRVLDSKEADELHSKKASPYVSNLGTDLGSFIENSNDLKNELGKWLKKIGIKDLNLKWNK